MCIGWGNVHGRIIIEQDEWIHCLHTQFRHTRNEIVDFKAIAHPMCFRRIENELYVFSFHIFPYLCNQTNVSMLLFICEILISTEEIIRNILSIFGGKPLFFANENVHRT